MSRTRSLLATVTLAFAGSTSSDAAAQTPTTPMSHTDSTLQRVVTELATDPRRPVRVRERGAQRIQGRALRLSADSVYLDTDDGVRAINRFQVDSIWVRRGSAALMVSTLTGIPCALLGALVGAAIASDPDSNGGSGREGGGALEGAALLGVPCALVGAGVGALIRHWPLVYAYGW
jgi:hypothetical protein